MTLLNLLKTLGITLLTFLAPIKGLLILVMLMVLLDFISALWATKFTKETITSHKMWNTVPKMICYLLAIIIGYCIDIFIIGGPLFGIASAIARFASIFVLAIELKSIDENWIKMGNESLAVKLKKIILFVKEFKSDLNNITDSKEDKKDETK